MERDFFATLSFKNVKVLVILEVNTSIDSFNRPPTT